MFQKSGRYYPADKLNAGGAGSIEAFCQIVYDEAVKEGVKPEIVFGQAMKETGYLQFGGAVKIEQFNFAGLGAIGGSVAGAQFNNVAEGIRAQVQHLKAYASKDSLTQETIDQRFNLVTRGSAPYVEWLGQKENPNGFGWATAWNYGISLMNQYTPLPQVRDVPDLNRRVTKREYEKVLDHALDLGITQGFFQEGGTAKESFIPLFDYEGL